MQRAKIWSVRREEAESLLSELVKMGPVHEWNINPPAELLFRALAGLGLQGCRASRRCDLHWETLRDAMNRIARQDPAVTLEKLESELLSDRSLPTASSSQLSLIIPLGADVLYCEEPRKSYRIGAVDAIIRPRCGADGGAPILTETEIELRCATRSTPGVTRTHELKDGWVLSVSVPKGALGDPYPMAFDAAEQLRRALNFHILFGRSGSSTFPFRRAPLPPYRLPARVQERLDGHQRLHIDNSHHSYWPDIGQILLAGTQDPVPLLLSILESEAWFDKILAAAIVRFCLALDQPSWYGAFLFFWQAAESITDPRERSQIRSDAVCKRLAALANLESGMNRRQLLLALNNVRDMRHNLVHQAKTHPITDSDVEFISKTCGHAIWWLIRHRTRFQSPEHLDRFLVRASESEEDVEADRAAFQLLDEVRSARPQSYRTPPTN